MNDEKVAEFLRQLLKYLPEDSIIVMDNASVHHSPQVTKIVQENSSKFLFTSAYSPDFNAIELLFGRTKMLLKNYYCSPATLQVLVQRILQETPASILAAFVHHVFSAYKNEC